MEWISIKKKLPKIDYKKLKSNVRVLVTNGYFVKEAVYHQIFKVEDLTVAGYIFHTFCRKCLDGEVIKNVTHWMPLPKACRKRKP